MNVRATDSFMAGLGVPEVYRVGGSVRDELLSLKPKDADYMVRGASIDQLRLALLEAARAAQRAVAVTPLKLRDGRQVGLRVSGGGLGLLEIALPRMEVSNGPGRHDFEIVTKPYLRLWQDAERRDFTINALYLDVRTGEVVDPLDGQADLRFSLLRTTHSDSFRDDPLRILRAGRFLSVLPEEFQLAPGVFAEMTMHADAMTGLTRKGVSGTALDELTKLLMGRRPGKALRVLRDTGALGVLFPELAPMLFFDQASRYHDMTTGEHTFTAIDAAAGMNLDLRVRLALLFHDAGKPEVAWRGEDSRLHYYNNGNTEDHEVASARLARKALDRLNTPKRLRNDVLTLVGRHMVSLSGKTKKAKVRRWRVELGDELLADLLKHRLADTMGKGTVDYDAMNALLRLETIRDEAERQRVPVDAKGLDGVDGHYLKDRGLEGKQIGRVLDRLLHEVVSQPTLNNRDWLQNRAAVLADKEAARA